MRNVNLTISTGANEPFATVVILYTAMIKHCIVVNVLDLN